MEQIKLLPDIPKHEQCLMCKGKSDGSFQFTFEAHRVCTKGNVKLCGVCAESLRTAKPNQISFSFYQCGGLAFIEEICIGPEKP